MEDFLPKKHLAKNIDRTLIFLLLLQYYLSSYI
jgi:hypothetical protein